MLQLIEPKERLLGTRKVTHRLADGREVETTQHDYAWDMPFEEQLQQQLEHNPRVWKEIQQSMASWRRDGHIDASQVELYYDISSGERFREKFAAMEQVARGAPVLMLMFYYDGLEVVNGLGPAHGTHKLACFYWTLLNLEPSHRTALHNVHLATITLESNLKHYPPSLIVSGAETEPAHSTSWGATMQRLQRGVSLDVPDITQARGFSRLVSHFMG